MERQQFEMRNETDAVNYIWREIEEKKLNCYVVEARAGVSNGLLLRWKKTKYHIKLTKYLSILNVLQGKIIAKSGRKEFKIKTYGDILQVLKKSEKCKLEELKSKTGIDEWLLARIKIGEYGIGTIDFMLELFHVMGYTIFFEFPESQELIL